MKIIEPSQPLNVLNTIQTHDEIILIYQFFIPKTQDRYDEIKKCLMLNVKNEYIDKIILLNERIYTDEELGTKHNKIEQVNFKKRLKFSDVFEYAHTLSKSSYLITINADIYLDDTISKIRYSNLHSEKTALALLRYNDKRSGKKLFGPLNCSQDTWGFHTNQNISKDHLKLFSFEFGTPGCDNKLIYLFYILGYKVINDPKAIKTFHVHENDARNYSNKPLNKPWGMLFCANMDPLSHSHAFQSDNFKAFAYLSDNFKKFNFYNDHDRLIQYIKNAHKTKAGFNIMATPAPWDGYGQIHKANSGSIHIWDAAFEIYNYLHYSAQPWTTHLNGMKVLIISKHAELMKSQYEVKDQIFGQDIFRGCTLHFSDMHHIQSEPDIILTDWHAADSRFKHKTIYVGKILQLYFGLYTLQWMRMYPDIFKLYVNKNWKLLSN